MGDPLLRDISLNNNPSAKQCHYRSQRQALAIHSFLLNVVGVPRESQQRYKRTYSWQMAGMIFGRNDIDPNHPNPTSVPFSLLTSRITSIYYISIYGLDTFFLGWHLFSSCLTSSQILFTFSAFEFPSSSENILSAFSSSSPKYFYKEIIPLAYTGTGVRLPSTQKIFQHWGSKLQCKKYSLAKASMHRKWR